MDIIEDNINLHSLIKDEYKYNATDEIVIAILAKNKGHVLPLYLECIYNQTYPKNKIHLYIRTNDNTDNTKEILNDFSHKYYTEYASIYLNTRSINKELKQFGNHEWNSFRFKILGKIRQESIDYAIQKKAHYFVIDCDNFIVPETLERMVKMKNLGIVSPMLITTNAYSNFHYDVDVNGYLKNHEIYFKLLNKEIKGFAEVKVVHCTYFINNNLLNKISYDDESYRYEYVIFSDTLRKLGIQQYLDNSIDYGFLTFTDTKEDFEKEYYENFEKMFKFNKYRTYITKYGLITLYNNEKYIGDQFKNNIYWDEDTLLKLKQYINFNKNILEIGGHCGTSSIVYSSFLNTNSKVYVFEVQKNMYNLLVKNIIQNNLQNKIIPYNKGVFCFNGKSNMHNIDLDGGGGDVNKRYNEEYNLPCNFGGITLGKDGEEIELITIDTLNLDNIGYIHCDAQGSENFIFSKGINTINKYRPIIFFEDITLCGDYLYNNVCKNYPKYINESKFNIENYCMNILKYSQCIKGFNGGNDTLLIP